MSTARMMRLHESNEQSIFTAEDMLQLTTRSLVREDFSAAIGDPKVVPDIQALKRVLFDIIYPCPGTVLPYVGGRDSNSQACTPV